MCNPLLESSIEGTYKIVTLRRCHDPNEAKPEKLGTTTSRYFWNRNPLLDQDIDFGCNGNTFQQAHVHLRLAQLGRAGGCSAI